MLSINPTDLQLASPINMLCSVSADPVLLARRFGQGRSNNRGSDADHGLADSSERSRGRVLIVDDVVDLAEMLSVFLTHAGFDVVISHSAADALGMAGKEQFDFIISDIGMPQMNGYELARTLRTQPSYQSVPMIAITGYQDYDQEESFVAGFNAHLVKPVDIEILLRLLSNLRNAAL